MAYVLAGGRGSRLMELTDVRAKPAVHFGGNSRIIDFALSNALNSGIRRMAVATQYKAHSLMITWRSGSPQGDPEPFHIEETDTSFAIDWKGHYRIAGEAFIYTDRDTGRITTVLGYPTDKLA